MTTARVGTSGTWLGRPTINDGRVLLVSAEQLGPGEEGDVRIEPLAPEFWGRVRVGCAISMQEGSRVVGHATILEIASRPKLFSPEIAAFVDQARQFCGFVDALRALHRACGQVGDAGR